MIRHSSMSRRAARTLTTFAGIVLAVSCTENLPNGPNTFAATLSIVIPHDTVVVGDNSTASAVVTDANGHQIQNLNFTWASADTNILGFVASSDSTGRTRSFSGKRTGGSAVTLTLPDTRFVTTPVRRNEVVVLAGVKVLSSHDTILTSVNDTGTAIAAGLVHASGATVTKVSQGVRWNHIGAHVAIVGSGDTIRYIARTNGADTLVATHDFCLAGAKCADTAIVRVSQSLVLTLSSKSFLAWSLGDTVGPTVTLADRRGNGQPGTAVRLVPATALDSVIVKTTAPVGISNPITGFQASPRLVSSGNGAARVLVLGLAPDLVSVVALDSITVAVRQIARVVTVEPLRETMSEIDSIPIKAVARDARGAVIADANVVPVGVDINVHDIWAGPTPIPGLSAPASITPTLFGPSLPENNPLAPQVPATFLSSLVTIVQADTATAGLTSARTFSFPVLDSAGHIPFGRYVRFAVSSGLAPDSVVVDGTGMATVTWNPQNIASTYTLSGVLSTTTPLFTAADSMGRVVLKRSILIKPDVPAAATSTVFISATTIAAGGTATVSILVRDQFNNAIPDAKPTDVTITSVGGGAFGAMSCVLGTCTVVYTAPAVAGPASISVKILGVEIVSSPIALTII